MKFSIKYLPLKALLLTIYLRTVSKDVFNSLATCLLDGYIVIIPVSVSVTLNDETLDSPLFFEFIQNENNQTEQLQLKL